jgi:hypothetical protein
LEKKLANELHPRQVPGIRWLQTTLRPALFWQSDQAKFARKTQHVLGTIGSYLDQRVVVTVLTGIFVVFNGTVSQVERPAALGAFQRDAQLPALAARSKHPWTKVHARLRAAN